MADYFRKTERGRREVRERSLNLSRSARNLLLILDSSKSLGVWIGMINGATLADGVALLESGLIEAQGSPGGPETRPAAFEPTEPMGHDLWETGPGALRVSPVAPVAAASPHSRPAPLAAAGAVGVTAPMPGPGRSAPPHFDEATGVTLPTLRRRVDDPPAVERPPAVSTPQMPVAPPTESVPPSLQFDENSGFVPLDGTGVPAGSGGLGYTELYDSLNALLRETLGLFRGYRYTLRIERAHDVTELEAVARDFVAEVKRLRGESMARMVQRALGLGG
jgi:hypothetical protein